MTYCVGLRLQNGLVMLADTRTNAGIDHVSTFSKLHVFDTPGERVLAVMTAGNLSITQSVITLLREGVEQDGSLRTLAEMPTMFRAAQLLGAAVRQVFTIDGPGLQAQNINFDVSFLMGGQIGSGDVRLFQVYAAGNFIEATADTPFLQIGEHKYGKPILDRAVSYSTDLYDAVKLVMISMDSTLRSNLSVGLPLDLLVYEKDSLAVTLRRRVTEDDEYFRMIHERWSQSLREAYRAIPRPPWAV